MDGQHFDRLTRLLGRPQPRRRLLQRAASVLAGTALAGGVARAQACPAGCPGTSYCCPNGFLCCPAEAICCDQVCCTDGWECVVFPENGQLGCRPPCPLGIRCGSACCAVGQTCESGVCVTPCPEGTAKCGINCCNAEQTCQDGACVSSCPVGRGRGIHAEAECEPPPCPDGTVRCGGTCVLECKPGRIMNVDTCACECEGQPCGAECCPADQECTFSGDDERSPRCCLKGNSCGLYCKGDPRIRCCKTGPTGVSISCDARSNQVCCGSGCCRRRRRRARRKH